MATVCHFGTPLSACVLAPKGIMHVNLRVHKLGMHMHVNLLLHLL